MPTMARGKDAGGSEHPEVMGHSCAKPSCSLPGSSSATERCRTCKIFMGISLLPGAIPGLENELCWRWAGHSHTAAGGIAAHSRWSSRKHRASEVKCRN